MPTFNVDFFSIYENISIGSMPYHFNKNLSSKHIQKSFFSSDSDEYGDYYDEDYYEEDAQLNPVS